MTSLSDYLAKNYLTADPHPKKKRKKTSHTQPQNTGLIIADDDPPDLRSVGANTAIDDDERPVLEQGARSAEFRRAKKSGWKSLTPAAAPTGPEAGGTGTDDADAILASAAAEKEARRDERNDEDAPTIAEDVSSGDGPRMESGARAGLQTASQTAAMVESQAKVKAAEAAAYKKNGAGAEAQETIYRDASGRIINVAMKRAEARKVEAEKKEKEDAAREAQMGDVQRAEREGRRAALVEAKTMPVARGIEDEEMNEEMRGVQRWNDPAAAFLTDTKGGGTSVSGRPLYRGAYAPNRYGIRPGHRWDGVDRATGFEKEWFASRNKKGRMEALEYQWQMDE